jgi:hypothetical protein
METKIKIKITKCLFPSKDGNWAGVPQPKIKGMECISTSMVKIDGKYYEQFEFVPTEDLLGYRGDIVRKGSYIYITKQYYYNY